MSVLLFLELFNSINVPRGPQLMWPRLKGFERASIEMEYYHRWTQLVINLLVGVSIQCGTSVLGRSKNVYHSTMTGSMSGCERGLYANGSLK